MKSKLLEGLVALIVVVVFAGLTSTSVLDSLELKVHDAFTRLVPPPPENKHITIVNVDDLAIQNVGQWPWSRDILAKILIQLKELGASYLTFDIEFVDRGPVGVTSNERDQTLASKTDELSQVFDAMKNGIMKPDEADDAAKTILSESVMMTARDNDAYLGKAAKLFGNTFTTINYDLPADKNNAEAQNAYKYLWSNSALPEVSGNIDSLPLEKDIRGAIVAVASDAKGAGVTNVYQDRADGTLRRINLLFRHRDGDTGPEKVFGQLAFVPLWDMLGRPPIVVGDRSITLRTSTLASNPRPDYAIPLDPSRYMIINWPHKRYSEDFFTQLKVSNLQDYAAAEDALVSFIETLRNNSYISDDFTGLHADAEAALQTAIDSGDSEAFAVYLQKKAAYFDAADKFANGDDEKNIVASLDATIEDAAQGEDTRASARDLKKNVAENFDKLRRDLASYRELRTQLASRLQGAFCFIGWTSAATTDIGVQPFDPVFYNVGTHAAIANTILSRAFLNEMPSWISFLIGSGIALLSSLLLGRLKALPAVSVGFGIFVAFEAAVGLVYSSTGTYIGALVPGLTIFITVLAITVVKFLGSEHDKAFYRTAFSSYLSSDVISQIIADPSKLNLGGVKRVMTAMFTDVRGFSTISEKLDPNDLVKLLNHYLTGMSDLILDSMGTIDKYEGDAIIAFWGAPLDIPDHAIRAVRTAILMKRAELAMNERLIGDGFAPSPLLTRIGVNTGEMTVGNMGTARRMDYTMMGSAVNLAARLEGVNKQYGTWVLCSESTQVQLDGSFLLRKLDRVRVVGIHTPVRLFEVVEEMSEARQAMKEMIGRFEAGIDLYEAGDWMRAARVFHAIRKEWPDDGPSRTFLERALRYAKAPPAKDWDGVFNLSEK